MIFSGYEVIATSCCSDLVQARRHKKKRINKKWRKRYGMKAAPFRGAYIDTANRKIYMHPIVYEKLKAKMHMRGY